MEMKDVSTPDASDLEGEDIDEPVVNNSKESLLRVEFIPRRETEYSWLYLCPEYRARAEMKVRGMKA